MSMADVNDKKSPSLQESKDGDKQEIDKVKSQVSTKSTRYLKLKTAKSTLTKARNHIALLTTEYPSTKIEIRRV